MHLRPKPKLNPCVQDAAWASCSWPEQSNPSLGWMIARDHHASPLFFFFDVILYPAAPKCFPFHGFSFLPLHLGGRGVWLSPPRTEALRFPCQRASPAALRLHKPQAISSGRRAALINTVPKERQDAETSELIILASTPQDVSSDWNVGGKPGLNSRFGDFRVRRPATQRSNTRWPSRKPQMTAGQLPDGVVSS